MMPPFHGFVYNDWLRHGTVTAVVPLNLLWAFARAAWAFLQYGGRRIYTNPRDAYMQGVRDGRVAATEQRS